MTKKQPPFNKLTDNQIKTLIHIFMGDDKVSTRSKWGHSPKTIRSLLNHGLIKRHGIKYGETIIRYDYTVPTNIYADLCRWLAS